MGQSTDAILFYGYAWSEETQLWDNDRYDEWEEVLATRRGIKNPWDMYRESGAEAEHSQLPYPQQRPAFEAWKEANGFDALLEEWRAAKEAIKSEFNVDTASHCSCDYPMPYVYIPSSKFLAWRGDPTTIPLSDLNDENTDAWNDSLTEFVQAMEIDISDAEGPGWFLVSNWC